MLVESITLIGKVFHFVNVRTGNGYGWSPALFGGQTTNRKLESKMHKSKLLRLKLMNTHIQEDYVLNNLSIMSTGNSGRSVKHRFDQNAYFPISISSPPSTSLSLCLNIGHLFFRYRCVFVHLNFPCLYFGLLLSEAWFLKTYMENSLIHLICCGQEVLHSLLLFSSLSCHLASGSSTSSSSFDFAIVVVLLLSVSIQQFILIETVNNLHPMAKVQFRKFKLCDKINTILHSTVLLFHGCTYNNTHL